MFKYIFTMILGVTLATSAWSKNIRVDMEDKDTLELTGIVSFGAVEPLVNTLLARAGKTKEVTIVINSPGGEVMSGLHLINVMNMAKSRGTRIKCVTTFVAASMAMQIFAACDSRYALRGSYLLFHPVRMSVGGSMFSPGLDITPSLAKTISIELDRLEKILITDLRTALPLDDKTFYHHYNAETLWTAKELVELAPGWATLVDDIVGIKHLGIGESNKTAPEAAGEVIYVWSGIGIAE